MSHHVNITRIKAVYNLLDELRDQVVFDDFEDIVFVLENRSVIWHEMSNAEANLRSYLLEEFRTLYKHSYIREWLDAHSTAYSPPSSHTILQDMENFITGLKF